MLLNFTGEMRLRHPRRAITKLIGQIDLIKEILKHHALRRHVAIDFGLTNGKEHVKLQSAPVRPPSIASCTPLI